MLMEQLLPIIKYFYLAGAIFGIVMVAIWICIWRSGGMLMKFEPPRPPEVLEMSKLADIERET